MSEEKYRPVSAPRQHLLLALIILFGYLFQVCVIPYVRIGSVTPNLLIALIGILTVTYGKLRAFWAACIFGLLTEIMLPSANYLNLALYPIIGLFCSFVFADKASGGNGSESALIRLFRRPWIRTILCALFNALAHETIRLLYVSINGTALTAAHIRRGLLSVGCTVLLTLIVMGPLRLLIRPRKRYRQKSSEGMDTEGEISGAVDTTAL